MHLPLSKPKTLSKKETSLWLNQLDSLKINTWKSNYRLPQGIVICDGESWELKYKQADKRCRHISGDNAYPTCWGRFIDVMDIVVPMIDNDRIEHIEINCHNPQQIPLIENSLEERKCVNLNSKETISIDRKTEKMIITKTLGSGCVITNEYFVEQGISDLLDDCEEYFNGLTDTDNMPCDYPQYELKITTHDKSTTTLKGGLNRRDLPESWNDFSERLKEFIDLYGVYADMINPKIFGRGRKCEEYIYCSVSFSKGGKTYYYRTEDDTIKIGDKVVVPVGKEYVEKTVIVENIEYFTDENIPMPLNKVKMVLGKDGEIVPNKPSKYIDMALNEQEVKKAIKNLNECDPNIYFLQQDIMYDMICFLGNDTEKIITFIKSVSFDDLETLSCIYEELRDRFQNQNFTTQIAELFFNKYRILVKYINLFKEQFSKDTVSEFIKEFKPFMDSNYQETLKKYSLTCQYQDIVKYNLKLADEELLIAMITAIIGAENNSDGLIFQAIEDGFINKCIERLFDELSELDEDVEFEMECYLSQLGDIWNSTDDERLKGENPAFDRVLDDISPLIKSLSRKNLIDLLEKLDNEQKDMLLPILEELIEEDNRLKKVIFPVENKTNDYGILRKYIDILKSDNHTEF